MNSKTSRPSPLQLIGLVKFMELNPDLSQGKITNSYTRKRLWRQISEELNIEKNGSIKTPDQWRKTWMDKKSSARSKLQRLQTFGGFPGESLSEIEKKILSVSGDLTVSGDPCISEGGSNMETSASQPDIQEESSLNGESEMVDTPPSISASEMADAPPSISANEIEDTSSPISKRRRGPNYQRRFLLLTSDAAAERFEEVAKKSAFSHNYQVPLLERLARAAEKQQSVMEKQLQVTEVLVAERVKQNKLLEKLIDKGIQF